MKVIVVGAGIAGLAAAWELRRAGVTDVTILESERRAGGVILSERVGGGFLVEAGPDGFLAGERDLPVLAEELGIGDHVVSQKTRGTTLWNGKELAPIDEGKAAALLGIEAKRDDVESGFRSFLGGMAEPVTALEQQLAGALRFAQGVAGLTPSGASWRLAITGGSGHEADAVVLAVPAYRAGRLLEAIGVAGARGLEDVIYLPSLTVSLAYREEQLGRPLTGAGFVTSPDAAGAVRACTFASIKFPGRAPAGHVLLRAFLAPHDGDAPAATHAELARILGIQGQPLWSRVFQWQRGLPRYRADHRELVADVRHRLERLPPLAITGAGYDGAGVAACVRSGREAGRLIARRLSR